MNRIPLLPGALVVCGRAGFSWRRRVSAAPSPLRLRAQALSRTGRGAAAVGPVRPAKGRAGMAGTTPARAASRPASREALGPGV